MYRSNLRDVKNILKKLKTGHFSTEWKINGDLNILYQYIQTGDEVILLVT